MKVLVTGGAGFIGAHLVARLVKQGDSVTVLDNFSTGKEENKNPEATYLKGDVRDDLSGFNDFDIIYHLAALARIQPSFDNPLETIDINTKGTANLCELANNNNSKLIYAASSSFYGGTYLNPYAFTKWQGEEICKMYSKIYNTSTAIARFFNVYGQGQPAIGPYATVVGIFEEQYRSKIPLTVTGDGKQKRDFTHVDDIVSGLILMSKDNWSGEIFNLGTGINYSINQLAEMYNSKIEYISSRPGEAEETLADISFSQKYIGYEPEKKLEDYVSRWVEKESQALKIK